MRALPRWARRLLFAVAAVVALLAIVRLVLDPVASHFTRKALNDAKAISGDFHSVHVSGLPPGYEIRRIKIVEHPGRTTGSTRCSMRSASSVARRLARAAARAAGGAGAAG